MTHHKLNHRDKTLEGEMKMIHLDEWKTCPDLATLFKMNRDFITGDLDLPVHPVGEKILYPSLPEISEQLLHMNERGLFPFLGDEQGETINPNLWTQMRRKQELQFCVPVDQPGGPSVENVAKLAPALQADARMHTTISWPKNLTLPLSLQFKFAAASLQEAQKYIPAADSDEYWHYKSQWGRACPFEIREALDSTSISYLPFWPARQAWSEVNDYHLLRSRVPEFFLGRDSKTVVFGISATAFDWKLGTFPGMVAQIARSNGFKKLFPSQRGKRGGVPVCLQDPSKESEGEDVDNQGEGVEGEDMTRPWKDDEKRVYNSVVSLVDQTP